METKLTECRGCKRMFKRIRGIIQYDERCCSERCYLHAGPRPVQELTTHLPKRKASSRRGKNNRKGGRDAFYLSEPWLKLRYDTLRTYGRCCMLCAETKGVMQVDHIKPRSKYPALALEPSNLQVLCKACNYGKSNRDETDFRPSKAESLTPHVKKDLR